MPMKLLIYVPLLSPRIKYIFSFIFIDVLKIEIDFTVNPEEFSQSPLPKLSYAKQPIGSELFFKSTNLLFEHKIKAQQIKKTKFGEMKVPFSVADGSLPFDIFAAAFFFLSRYEEYTHNERQNTTAFTFKDSLQYRMHLLKLPVIDNWAMILKNLVLKQYPNLTFGSKQFAFQPVYIDYPSNNKGILSKTVKAIKTFIDTRLKSKSYKITGIKGIITEMQRYDSIKNPNLSIPETTTDHHYMAELRIPKSYIKLGKLRARNDYSMYYPGHPGFRAGTCTPFFWYDLQMEKKTRLLLHPVVLADIDLLKNKTTEALLLQMNELISSVKLVNGDFYFLSLCDDIRPQ